MHYWKALLLAGGELGAALFWYLEIFIFLYSYTELFVYFLGGVYSEKGYIYLYIIYITTTIFKLYLFYIRKSKKARG